VNLDTLEARYPNGGDVNPESLVRAGVIKNNKKPIKVLGRGNLSNPLHVSAHKFSETAKNTIQAAGGSVQVIE
jgi:large subunit ribosomal protein L15